MDPLTMMLLGTGISALSSIPQWLTGDKQDDRADELGKNLVRPKAELASGYADALKSAEEQAKMTRLRGQSAIEGRLDQTTANQVAMLERLSLGGADMINGSSRAYGNQQDKENQLGIAASDMWSHNQDVLRNEQHIVGDQENRIWDINELQPYENTAAAIQALKEGAIRNKSSALKNVFGSLGNGIVGAGLTQSGTGNWWDKLTNPSASSLKTGVGASDSLERSLFDVLGSGNQLMVG